MDRVYLVAKNSKVDAGSLHFTRYVSEGSVDLQELTVLSRTYRFFEWIRLSMLGKGLRRLGVMARLEYVFAKFIWLPGGKQFVSHTHSFMFLLIISKAQSPLLYSYDLPWTYYFGSDRRFVKKTLSSKFTKFKTIYCITSGMEKIYKDIGLKNTLITKEFYSELKTVGGFCLVNRKPLYIGNIRFLQEFNALADVIGEKIIHYGVPINNKRLVGMGFTSNLDEILESSDKKYYGICVFSFKDVELARSSIPSKLLTYSKLGIPVLYYGPSYSEGYRLCLDRGIGFAVENLADLQKVLETRHL